MSSTDTLPARRELRARTTAAVRNPHDAAAHLARTKKNCRVLTMAPPTHRADVRSALADLLRASGHAVTIAASADEALEVLEHTHQSLVLSDVDLGGNTHGVELMRQIAERHPRLPRILMSGLPAEILTSRFGLTDDQPLLSKPFTIPQLYVAINQATALFSSERT